MSPVIQRAIRILTDSTFTTRRTVQSETADADRRRERTGMRIYFAASIRGGGIDPETCKALVLHLKGYGTVFTEHICREAGGKDDSDTDEEIYERDIRWLEASDVVVAEVSVPSLGVGYEVGRAEEWGKRVLCLYKKDSRNRLSAMIGGNRGIAVEEYEEIEEALALIDGFLGNPTQ